MPMEDWEKQESSSLEVMRTMDATQEQNANDMQVCDQIGDLLIEIKVGESLINLAVAILVAATSEFHRFEAEQKGEDNCTCLLDWATILATKLAGVAVSGEPVLIDHLIKSAALGLYGAAPEDVVEEMKAQGGEWMPSTVLMGVLGETTMAEMMGDGDKFEQFRAGIQMRAGLNELLRDFGIEDEEDFGF